MTKRGLALRLSIAILVLITAAAVIYRAFFVWFVRVPTGAMLNTIVPGDQLVVHRLFSSINRGDIVAFQYPGDQAYYIARVVGLPGETIQTNGKLVYINGQELGEQRVCVEAMDVSHDPLKELSTEGSGPYRVYYNQRSCAANELSPDTLGDFAAETPFQVPNDSYFILGDNRNNSYDSRFRGAVPRNLIWGRPSFIYNSVKMPDGDLRLERVFKRVQ